MSTNKTSNYSLNQWVKSDQVRMEDFNADNAKLDAALKAHDTSLASKATTSALNSLKSTVTSQGTALGLRNCRFVTGSYQGTGAGKPITLTFPYKPVLVFVCSSLYPNFFLAVRGQSITFRVYNPDIAQNYLVWGEKTLKWSILSDFGNASPSHQMDANGDTYNYFALLEVD